jgi:hypothetical protein
VNFIVCTIPPVREIVIVISDLYLAAGQTGASTDAGAGAGALGTLPGFEHAARFGQRRSIEGEGGWRPWLARWLGRNDLAGVAPAVIAAGAADGLSRADAAAADAPALADAATAPETLTPAAAVAAVAAVQPGAIAAQLPFGSTVWIATPVHLIAGLTSLHLDRRSILRLSPTELEGFALDFNRTFGGSDLLLKPLPSGDFLLHGPATLIGSTTEPARALVGDLEASLPKGTDAKPLKRLGAELEMWLHATPLNETRQRRGELSISTLWLWGGGPLAASEARPGPTTRASPNTTSHSAATTTPANSTVAAASGTHSPNAQFALSFGTDRYLAGLWHLQGGRTNALPYDQLASLFANPDAQCAVLVTEVTPLLHSNPQSTVFDALAELDRLYVSPAIDALRTGAVGSVVLIANDAEIRVGRRDRLKFWRRRQSTLTGLQP